MAHIMTREVTLRSNRLSALIVPCALALLPLLPLGAQVPKAKRPRVCVMEFPVSAGAYEGWGGWGYGRANQGEGHISSALQELMVTALLTEGTGKIRLIERKRLEELLAEQKLGSSGLVDDTTAVKMGNLDFIVRLYGFCQRFEL